MNKFRTFMKGVLIGFFTPWKIGKVMDDTVQILMERQGQRGA